MSKSAARIEAEITSKVVTRKLRARGLWWTLRSLVEQNGGKFPGDVRTPEGAALTAEAIGLLANATAATVLSCLHQLEAVKLVKVLPDATIHCPPLARLHEIRASGRSRWRKCVKTGGRVLANTQKGVRWSAANTPANTHPPPPFSLSPTTPISYPPTPADAAGAREGGHAGADLDAEVRRFVGGHPMLTPSPRAYARTRKLVEAVGWEGARHAIDDAVAKGATDPPSYALAVVGGEQARERVAADNRNGRGHTNGAKPRKKQTPEEWARQPYTPMGPAER